MERLTKIDSAGRNVIEVKKFCKDDDWVISKMADGITTRFHSKATDKLAEFEDFMEEQGFESLEDLKNTVSHIEKLMLTASKITKLEQKNQKLKQQLAEKEKEIRLLNAMINTLPEHDKELEEIHNEKKITFAIEQLEKVKEFLAKRKEDYLYLYEIKVISHGQYVGCVCEVETFELKVDDQIKQLKEGN